MTRILYWSELFLPYLGGAEVVGGEILRSLHSSRFAFTLITSHHNIPLPDRSTWGGIPIHRLPFRQAIGKPDFAAMSRCRTGVEEALRLASPDLIHLASLGPSAAFLLKSRAAGGVPMVATLHQVMLPSQNARDPSLLKQVLGRADWVTAVSSAVLEQARDIEPSIGERSSVTYNFVRPFASPPAELPLRPPRLLCLGRMVPQKGLERAVQAFAFIRERIPDARLTMVGDGESRARLEQQCRELELDGSVTFPGAVFPHQVDQAILGATLLLMPSHFEGLPMVAIEAAQLGRPVVGSRVGGMPEVVLHGKTGWLLDRADPRELADAVIRLLSVPDQLREMGAAAAVHASTVFSREACLARYVEVYDRLRSYRRSPEAAR